MSDDPQRDEDSTTADVQRGIQAGAQAAQGAVGAVQAASSGDAAGTVAGLAGGAAAVAGAAGGEAGEAVATGARVVQTGAQVVGAAQRVGGAASSGDVAGAAQGLGSAAGAVGGSPLVQDRGAREALGAGGQALGSANQGGAQPTQRTPQTPSTRRAESSTARADAASGSQAHDAVSFHVEIDGIETLSVRSVHISEALNQLGSCAVRLVCREPPVTADLLRKECTVSIERSDQRRMYKGVVRQARVGRRVDDVELTLHLVPGLWYLSQIVTSRVHQNTTVPALVASLVEELLGDSSRAVRDATTGSYQEHEYLVQYQESYLDFINRLCEHEGIFWYLDHESDRETLVLADSTAGLPQVREGEDARIRHAARASIAQEEITAADHQQQVGPTDAVLAEYDWTRPQVPMRGEQTGRGTGNLALEVYDHTDAITFHRYDDLAFRADTGADQALLRAQRLDLDRQDWSMQASLVGARPGHVFEVVDCPDADLDGRYMIVTANSHGASDGGRSGGYRNDLSVVPLTVPYRPPRTTPRPVIAGFESATVVTDGQEIQTDVHGRVKVQFHWDRLGERNDQSSCWLRVVHNWAGEGFGTFFLPRKGMEVIVGFLGGNPDRPIVTGCVYNGDNRARVELDAKKTQSVIRTKSSPDSEGFNELRFEDETGGEFISVHAQKDYNETVLHDHSTHVHNDQTNTVDGNQTEKVGREQKMTVDKNRTVHVKGSQSFSIDGGEETDGITGSKLQIKGDYKVDVSDWIEIEAPTHIQIKCGDSIIRMEPGRISLHAGPGAEIVLDANARVQSNAGSCATLDDDVKVSASTGGALALTGDAELSSIAGSNVLLDVNAKVTSSKKASVELTADAELEGINANVVGKTEAMVNAPHAKLVGKGGSVKAGATGVEVSGGTVDVSGSSGVTIAGAVVRIN
ncbi:MAG: type VI secretion system tip protein VgrG [Sandaracinaceae bacterium]|nr:type VI secretion system tip protein VgrG [Sandaracinaceae bacterium]